MEEIKEEQLDGENLHLYEAGYHLLSTLEEAEAGEEASQIKSLISKNGGSIVAEGAPELINLSYPISKEVGAENKEFNKSYFGWVKFKLSPDELEKVDKGLKSKPGILRFILIKSVLDGGLTPKPGVAKEEKEASAEEIDKSIEDLVIA